MEKDENSSVAKANQNLVSFRKMMEENKYDAYIVPHSDRHDVKLN